MQIDFPVESTHSHFAGVEVRDVKTALGNALPHLEKVEILTSTSTNSSINVFAERAHLIAEMARSLRRDLDHVV